jgi:hypothetical protein
MIWPARQQQGRKSSLGSGQMASPSALRVTWGWVRNSSPLP